MPTKITHTIAVRIWDTLTIVIPAALLVASTWLLHTTSVERLIDSVRGR